MARHAAGALGHSAGAVDPGLVVAVRSDPQRVQLAAQELRRQRNPLAQRSLLGAFLGDPGERLVRGAVLSHYVFGRAQIGARAALRSGRHRRGQRLAEIRAHHAADDAQHHRHPRVVLADRHLRQFRHRADHDRGRAAQHDARIRHLRVPARHPLRRPAARRRGVAVHVSDPGDLGRVHPARRAQAREGNRMTATAAVAELPRIRATTSLRRSRRWSLFASYFFLILFAIFFLTPPYYMIVTSLKSDAEVAHLATNPWIIANGVTFEQYRLLFKETDFLVYFKNTVIVTVCVVAITMVVSVLAAFSLSRMRFWGSGLLATGIFLTYLIPDTLLFIPLFQIVRGLGL